MRDRRAVLDLPLRLILVLLVISLSAPVAISALEDMEEGAAGAAMEAAARRIMNVAAELHYGGCESTQGLSLSLPSDCRMEIGGDAGTPDAMSIRCYYRDKMISTCYVEGQMLMLIGDSTLGLEGDFTLRLRSTFALDYPAVEVTVL